MYKKIILAKLFYLNILNINCSEAKPILLSDIVSEYIYNIDQAIDKAKHVERPLRTPQSVHQANINNQIVFLEGLKIRFLNCWQARDEWKILQLLPAKFKAKMFDAKADFDTPVLDTRASGSTID